MPPTVRIRDPIHGTQKVTKAEISIIDHPAVQRLRGIKQLGMADFAYPGATHTRYAHALGVMHVAGRVFDAVSVDVDLHPSDRYRLSATLRLAALFHDLGHAPLSHSTELMMPEVGALDLGVWTQGRSDRRASHEDYTLAIVLHSDLTRRIESALAGDGVVAEDVAALLTDHPPPERAARFVVDGRDWRPFLRQLVSSELDADRMDYLLRDSYFAGVPYGRYDLEWLLENLRLVERPSADEGRPRAFHLGLAARASFGFEDYLLSRFHMFLAVYLHHVPVGYELMLERLDGDQRAGRADAADFALPADVDAYLAWDDVRFFHLLRGSTNEWARRIVERRGYRLLLEHKQQEDDESDPLQSGRVPLREVRATLERRAIPYGTHAVRSRLSKYFQTQEGAVDPELTPHLPGLAPGRESSRSPTIFVVEDGRAVPLETHVALYRRYRSEVSLERIYVPPERLEAARDALAELVGPRAR